LRWRGAVVASVASVSVVGRARSATCAVDLCLKGLIGESKEALIVALIHQTLHKGEAKVGLIALRGVGGELKAARALARVKLKGLVELTLKLSVGERARS
jgi:hypothetical protein